MNCKLSALLLAVLTLSQVGNVARAQEVPGATDHDTGNGGWVFDPVDDLSNPKYVLYDFAEWGNGFRPSEQDAFKNIIKPRFEKLAKKLPNTIAFLNYLFTEGGASWFWVDYQLRPGAALRRPTTQPSMDSLLNPNLVLTYKQVQAGRTFPDQNVTQINKNIWDSLKSDFENSEMTGTAEKQKGGPRLPDDKGAASGEKKRPPDEQRAFLLVHENLWQAELSGSSYKYFDSLMAVNELRPFTTPEKIRVLTGLLLSDGFAEKDARTMYETIAANSAKTAKTYDWTYFLRSKRNLSPNVTLSEEQRKTNNSPIAQLAYLDTIAVQDSESAGELRGDERIRQQGMTCLNKNYGAEFSQKWKVVSATASQGKYLDVLVMDRTLRHEETPELRYYGPGSHRYADYIKPYVVLRFFRVKGSDQSCETVASDPQILRLNMGLRQAENSNLVHYIQATRNYFGNGLKEICCERSKSQPLDSFVTEAANLSYNDTIQYHVKLNPYFNDEINEPEIDLYFTNLKTPQVALPQPPVPMQQCAMSAAY
jgi:hypothetical protein